jgi:glycosyltransferase involved in cell wall biosynthesis
MKENIDLVFATNDSRSKNLEKELEKKVNNFFSISYDPLPFLYKYIAAGLSFHRDRKVWWNRYQWYALTQLGRKRNLINAIKESNVKFNTLLMWGSWFNPLGSTQYHRIPFYVYIDQSCNKLPDAFDIQTKALDKSRKGFNQNQFVTYQECKSIFCMSDWARRQTLESHNIHEEKVCKVGWGPIGINLLNEDILVNENEPTVLFVGHDFYRKGVDFLREAIPLVVREVPTARFVVVGENSDKLSLQAHPNLELTGAIRDIERMKVLYRKATIFVLPHRFDRSPHVLVEAMSAGKPIVTSNQGGAVEVVQNGKNGFIIEVGDIKALANSIVKLLKDKDLCKAFGTEAKKIMSHDYTWEAVASKMITIINATR